MSNLRSYLIFGQPALKTSTSRNKPKSPRAVKTVGSQAGRRSDTTSSRCLLTRRFRLGMLNVNLHFLGRGFVEYWDDELEQPVAEACLDVFGLHILREGNQALDRPLAELAVKEVALLGFVLLLTRGADRQHVAHNVHRDVLGVDAGQLEPVKYSAGPLPEG